MKRLLPQSLLGQTLFAIGAALLITQLVSATLLYRAAESRLEASVLNRAALALLVDPEARERIRRIDIERSSGFAASTRGPWRRMRTRISDTAPLMAGEANMAGRASDLANILASQGIRPVAVQLTERRAGDDPAMQARARRSPRFAARPGWADETLVVAGIQLEQGGPWRTTRVTVPRREPRVIGGIVVQTAILFIVLMTVLFFFLRRITQPLARLTERVSDFSRRPDKSVTLKESGPSDTRRLIAAHNAMEARIAALLDEKDVMLGAIGHDLKTPLAALRVRIESVPDDVQRQRMAESIEDITATLDDILTLARVGRSRNTFEQVDLGALAAGIVDEFEDLGQPVAMMEFNRIVAPVQVTWLKRALRNLVSNAVRYGESAEISVIEEKGHAILRVDDHGPGIPPDRIAKMMEPFTRGEASRNRATGGAGLGLTLARAIAQQHGGDLVLNSREEGGLRAEIRIPLAK
ncbi:sensor histidine kinase [Erythrobacter rubeus]|uniref:histidine kinase n=1 Tax=Erythrobacter rubeus TaxID=2760803 RepID=A0ABR8KXX0_9SPHN|nr:ATP-binding protein [Erythrobacter rubeus]MBD2843001.1 two-component sensor histidine kinase [Erythrobacter rubeus]